MDFDGAIKAHNSWKDRLNSFVGGWGCENLTSRSVSKDDQCALGRWIYGEGQAYKNSRNFANLVKHHKRFHEAAGKVVSMVEACDKCTAKQIIAGMFTQASKDTVEAIKNLKIELDAGD